MSIRGKHFRIATATVVSVASACVGVSLIASPGNGDQAQGAGPRQECRYTPYELMNSPTDSWDIVARADGCAEVSVAATENEEVSPSISPDSKEIAFVRFSSDLEATNIVVHDLETGQEEKVLESATVVGDVVWSPDATRLAYWKNSGTSGQPAIWVFDLASRKEFQLTHFDTPTIHPDWSRDSASISYTVADPQGSRVGISAAVEGAEQRLVTPIGTASSHPSFSPDGSQLAVATTDEDDVESATTLAIVDLSSGVAEDRMEVDGGILLDTQWSGAGLEVVLGSGAFMQTETVSLERDEAREINASEFDYGIPGDRAYE